MPIIQPIIAERGLGGAPQPAVQRDGSIGRAVQGLGNALSNAAQAEQEMQTRQQLLDLKVQNFRTDQNFRQFQEGLGSTLDEAQSKMDPSGQGLTTNFIQQFDKKSADFLATVPDALKPKFSELVKTSKTGWLDRVAHSEREQRYSWFRTGISDSQEKLQAQVFNDPSVYDAAKADGLRAIEASGLPDAEKEVLRKKWDETLALTIGERDVRDAQENPALAKDAARRYGVTGATTENGGDAMSLVREHEGFRPTPYWDVNAYRIGYGSDTITTADGKKVKVTQGMKITRADAERDLARRVKEFEATARDQVGGRAWGALPANAQAALVSVAYNYGRLPTSVANAIKSGNINAVADAVENLDANKGRRREEAAVIRGGVITSNVPDDADPRLASLSLKQRLDLFDRTMAAAKRGQAEIQVTARNDIENAVTNAPVAFQNTGQYDGEIPSREKFVAAYGEDDGGRRYDAFQASVETSKMAYQFGSMSEGEIRASVSNAQPISSGDNAALEQKRYEVLSKAADASIKAREADPATYTSRMFPSVAAAWQDAQDSGDYTNAISVMGEAQRQLGIQKISLMPKAVAEDAVRQFKNDVHSDQERLDSVASLIFATSDPQSRQAIFAQLVDAGLPAMTEGVIEAYARGDRGAAHRLMQAVVADPSKLPKNSNIRPADISTTIYSNVWSDGEVGDVAYGLSYGDASSLERAQRGTDLLSRAVQLRIAQGEDLQTAVDNAKKDLFGDVSVYDGGSGVNAEIAVPNDTDMSALTRGLNQVKSDFALALADQRDRLARGGNIKASDGSKAVFDATVQNRMNDVINNGVFVSVGNGIGLRDPYTGQFVTDVDGKTPLSIPLNDILERGKAVSASRGEGQFDKAKAGAAYKAGMGQIEGWTGQ